MGADHEARGAGVRTGDRSRARVRNVRGHRAQRGDAMNADEIRESIFQDLVAGRIAGDPLRERVAALARVMGVPAAAILLDLYVEVRGLG